MAPPSSRVTNTPTLHTERLRLRRFTQADIPAIFALFSDTEVNRFLPFFPVTTMAEAKQFYEERFARFYREYDEGFRYAVCVKETDEPIGYVVLSFHPGYDFGYCLRKEFWGKGITTEAGRAVLTQAQLQGVPFVTATHDVRNVASGVVMHKLGMRYQYSYTEQWQPKNELVTFRLYQLNFSTSPSYVFPGHNSAIEQFVEDIPT